MIINILFLFAILIILIQFILIYGNFFYMILLLAEVIIFMCLWFIINKRWNCKKYSNLNCNQLIIEMMNKYRHDIANDIQIISCYATLKRNEDIIEQITVINNSAIQQGLIADFANEALTAYLYKIHALFPNLTIDLEIEEDIILVKNRYKEKLVYEIFDEIIKEIYLLVEGNIEQHLFIYIGNNNENLIISLEFEGSVAKIYDRILKIGRKISRNNGEFVISLNTDKMFIVDMYFPLKKV